MSFHTYTRNDEGCSFRLYTILCISVQNYYTVLFQYFVMVSLVYHYYAERRVCHSELKHAVSIFNSRAVQNK